MTKKKTAAKKKTAGTRGELPEVFAALRAILVRYAKRLDVTEDSAKGYSLQCKTAKAPNGSPMFFAATTMRTSTVNFYLMPVYVHPELLESISPELKKRMQGKSCFNFKKVDAPLFKQLAALTKAGFDHWRAEGMR
ncbi:MAG: hypothetical protein AAF721_20360 [Myxococcota bacterium]